jgi:Fe-S-cluster containining protein
MITCDECDGECCKTIAIDIETPRLKEDFENIRWYLYHKGLSVYVDNQDTWLVLIPFPCEHRQKDGKCAIYDKRPPICQVYSPEDCEKNVKEVKFMFSTVEDYDNWLEKHKRFK